MCASLTPPTTPLWEANSLWNLMFYKGWLSFTKLFGFVQLTVYGHGSIRGEILHFKHPHVSAVNRLATRAFRERKNNDDNNANNKADSILRQNFNVFIDLDNWERARTRDKKTKETNYVGRKTLKFYSCGWENEKYQRPSFYNTHFMIFLVIHGNFWRLNLRLRSLNSISGTTPDWRIKP